MSYVCRFWILENIRLYFPNWKFRIFRNILTDCFWHYSMTCNIANYPRFVEFINISKNTNIFWKGFEGIEIMLRYKNLFYFQIRSHECPTLAVVRSRSRLQEAEPPEPEVRGTPRRPRAPPRWSRGRDQLGCVGLALRRRQGLPRLRQVVGGVLTRFQVRTVVVLLLSGVFNS